MEYLITLGYRDGNELINMVPYRKPADLAVPLNRLQATEAECLRERLGFTSKGVDNPFGYVYWLVKFGSGNRWVTQQLGGRAVPDASKDERERVRSVVKMCLDYYSVRYGYTPFVFNSRPTEENQDDVFQFPAEEDVVDDQSRQINLHFGAKATNRGSAGDGIIQFRFYENDGVVSTRMRALGDSDLVLVANRLMNTFKERNGIVESGEPEHTIGELTWRFRRKNPGSDLLYTRCIALHSKKAVSAASVEFMKEIMIKVATHMDCSESVAMHLGMSNAYVTGRKAPSAMSKRTRLRALEASVPAPGASPYRAEVRAVSATADEFYRRAKATDDAKRSKYAAKIARRREKLEARARESEDFSDVALGGALGGCGM